jgi:hypothetical protein
VKFALALRYAEYNFRATPSKRIAEAIVFINQGLSLPAAARAPALAGRAVAERVGEFEGAWYRADMDRFRTDVPRLPNNGPRALFFEAYVRIAISMRPQNAQRNR